MHKSAALLLGILLAGGHAALADGEYLQIRANGQTDALTIQAGTPLTVTLDIFAGDFTGLSADWWVVAETGGLWYHYDLASGSFQPGQSVTYQEGLFSFNDLPVITGATNLPDGIYNFYFGIDTIVNGQVDFDVLVYRQVAVTIQASSPGPGPSEGLLRPDEDFHYLGAFRLPPDPAFPFNGFEWGGMAFTHFPGGDPDGPDDGFPGSLYGTGHAQHMRVGEISIPVPVISAERNLEDLPMAALVRGFRDIREGIPSLENLYENRMILYAGLAYLPAQPGIPARLYSCFGDHFHDPDSPQDTPSHMWTDLSLTDNHGAWWVGTQSLYSVNNYMFGMPAAWVNADAGPDELVLATGRFREGGWSGMGPSIFAIAPWSSGNPPAAGAVLPNIPLLLYSNTRGDDPTSFTMTGYLHADNWFDAGWLRTDGRAAVAFLGLKGLGEAWYGYSDGTVVPVDGVSPEPPPPPYPNNARGWWSTSFQAMLLLYDPADLARVGTGTLAPHEPQPYGSLNLDPYLWNIDKINHPDFDVTRNKYRVGGMAFDSDNGLLYVAEDRGDAELERPLLHVFRVGPR